jgi:hypothetical protein
MRMLELMLKMLSSMRNYDIASLSVVDELAENPILPE